MGADQCLEVPHTQRRYVVQSRLRACLRVRGMGHMDHFFGFFVIISTKSVIYRLPLIQMDDPYTSGTHNDLDIVVSKKKGNNMTS